MNNPGVYNDIFVEDSRDLEIVFERDQLHRTWSLIAIDRGLTARWIKKRYEEAKETIRYAKKYIAAKARLEWFYRYRNAISWGEYDKIERDVLDMCGISRELGIHHDYVKLNLEYYEGHPNEYPVWWYNADLVNELIIKHMKHMISMKKKAAKAITQIEWVKESESNA